MATDTIVLIHGLWMTPRCWERWIPYYQAKGFQVIAPAYPGLDVGVEALRADPSPIEALTMSGVIQHFQDIINELDHPPILMGHSQGGLITQILLDHGFGAAGVAIDSVAAQGIYTLPPSEVKAGFPVLKNPANRHRAVPFTPEEFRYAFTNTLSQEESLAVYERYHIPAPGSFIWGGVLANFTPGHHDSYVNFKNDNRAPLLFIAGGADHIVPPAVNKSNANHYHGSKAVTDYQEFPGRTHYTLGQEDWEEVADYALNWACNHITNSL